MILLPPTRYFSCRHKGGKNTSSSLFSDAHSTTSSFSDSRSDTSLDSLYSATSATSRIQALLLDIKVAYTSSLNYAAHCVERNPHENESNSEADVFHEAVQCLSPIDDASIQSPSSSSSSDLPHDCECNSRSVCPDFLQQHFVYMQTHEWRHLPGVLVTTYYVSADDYAQARDALLLPTAKLERAKAEYEWANSRKASTRLWAPRMQEELVISRRKVIVAKQEWEMASVNRWQKAQALMDIGRF